jgi:hypothetical protein
VRPNYWRRGCQSFNRSAKQDERRSEMRLGNGFIVVGLMSLVLVVICAGSIYAQPTAGNTSYAQSSATAYGDNVVSPKTSALQAAVTSVHWTRWRHRPWGRWWRPYRYRHHFYRPYYRYYRPYYRCWWNGWRWVCPSRRIIIY